MKKILPIIVVLALITSLYAQEAPNNSVLKSAILPGWGELSYQSNSAYTFLGIEAALWVGFAGLRYSGYVQNQDLMNYARLNAGVSDYPESHEYWADLGNYLSRADHEEDMLELRKPEEIWSNDYNWDWVSEDELMVYERLFRNKELTLLSSQFVLTGMIVNRIASVINVRYLNNKNMQLSAFAAPVEGGAFMQIALNF